MKRAVLALILLFPSILSAQSGAGITERTYRVNPNVADFNREVLELTLLVADDKGRSLSSRRILTGDEYSSWEAGGVFRHLLLMKLYDSGLADIEKAVVERKAVGRESVDPRNVQSFVTYDDILKFRVAKSGVDRIDQQLTRLRASIELMEKDTAELEAQQEEFRRQLLPVSLLVSEPSVLAAKGVEGKLETIRELVEKGAQSKSAVPELVRTILDSRENAAVRMTALAALGHIGVDSATADRIAEVARRESSVFGGSASSGIVNGGFEVSQNSRQPGVASGNAVPPGSVDFKGWITSAGIVGTQGDVGRPGGRIALELGPRDPPGCISQTVLTTVARNYELRFFTDTGRDFTFNNRLHVRVSDVTRTVTARVGTVPELVRIPFKAAFPMTTVTFCGEGTEQFGPVIDEVSIEPAQGE